MPQWVALHSAAQLLRNSVEFLPMFTWVSSKVSGFPPNVQKKKKLVGGLTMLNSP